MSLVRVISVLKSKGINSVITVLKDNPNHDEKGRFAPGPHTGDLKKTGEKQGTVPGGIYKDQTTGHSYVVKDYKNNLQAASEHASNQLYRAAGIAVPESSIVQNHQGEGKHSFASQMIDKLGQGKEQVNMAGAQLAKGYGVDALTANWDVIGTGHDNIGFKNNQPIRLDQGGTLMFRAQGGTKDFPGTKVDELKSLLDPNKNPNTSAVYNKAFSEDKSLKVDALEKAGAISDKEIEHAVHSSFGAVGADTKLQESLIGGLKGRRDLIQEEANNLRVSMKQEEEQKAQRVQRLLERAAAIKAGTIKIEEKPRKGKEELSVVEQNNLASAMGKSDAELKTLVTSLYEKTGINEFVRGKTGADNKEAIAKSAGIMQARAVTQAILIKQGFLKYDSQTGTMSAVDLHRGIGMPRGEAMKLKEGDNFDFGHLACFSESEAKSTSFAHNNGNSSYIRMTYQQYAEKYPASAKSETEQEFNLKRVPVLVTASTPGKRIVGSHRVGAGAYTSFPSEKEMTIHQPHRMRVTSVEIKKDIIHVHGEFKG